MKKSRGEKEGFVVRVVVNQVLALHKEIRKVKKLYVKLQRKRSQRNQFHWYYCRSTTSEMEMFSVQR